VKAGANDLMARVLWLHVLVGVVLAETGGVAAGAPATNPAPVPNRTRPNVEPFKTVLEFSSSPTVEEIFRAHVFQEPLVPVGPEPAAAENSALAAALQDYARRSGPDDFSALTGFLQAHPQSSWAAALLTDLGLDYYTTAHYSLALNAWSNAWQSAQSATELKARALADRAFSELVYMNARLGRMDVIQLLLKSIENRPVRGGAAARVADVRAALWMMKNRPQVCFRCGPLALRNILKATGKGNAGDAEIFKSASTQKGCSLAQVAGLSRTVGLDYQMAFRTDRAPFLVPAVVHWKVGHYAALVKEVEGRYELKDPTFGNETWATKEALEAETSGYYLVPSGPLPAGWRAVEEAEGAAVWGKGETSGNDPRQFAPNDKKTGNSPCSGMAVVSVHLMLVNLNLNDEPVGYTPPVGPPVRFKATYNDQDSYQPANFDYANFGPQWTCNWISYITDAPSNLLADVNQYVPGGGIRTFTGFDPNQQAFEPQQYDNTRLLRTGPSSYSLVAPDGSQLIYAQPNGAIGAARNVFLTQIVDPQSNALTLTYDNQLRLVSVTDAIGQVSTITYGLTNDLYKITQITDPFGRFATFQYDSQSRLVQITDLIGLTSQFVYNDIGLTYSDFIKTLTTSYGNTSFVESDHGNIRRLDITYPDGSRERVEYNQFVAATPFSDPPASVPVGMLTHNLFLPPRDTYYWSRTGCALGYGDYSKARIFHFLHTEDLSKTAGALESVKEPLENHVWYDYPGQSGSFVISSSTLPAHVGRVLDDGSTQLYTYAYNAFGHVTNAIDPVGRNFTYVYATNGIDLLQVRQTRAGNNELNFSATYNSQHLPLTQTDAAGQTTTYTYNSRGQILTRTDPLNQVTSWNYDANGYLTNVTGPLPGTNDTLTFTYDAFGRVRTWTDESGYTLAFAYDNLDRPVTVTYPDGSFAQTTYDRLDAVTNRDRAGRITSMTYDSMRQMSSRTDPLGRTTYFEWCTCGDLKSLTDPMGHTTTWTKDVQGRLTAKQYADGSRSTYQYENTTSRISKVTDERQQVTAYAYYPDDRVRSVFYPKAAVPTPAVTYLDDPNYVRTLAMTDGAGTTAYNYIPITSPPLLGAGKLGSMTGPLTNETISYTYDELGRVMHRSIDGVAAAWSFDAENRVTTESNALGNFSYAYDGASWRPVSQTLPNGLTGAWSYGDILHDFVLQQITYAVRATPVCQFTYGRDIDAGRLTNWVQQSGSQTSNIYSFGYDAADKLLSATVASAGVQVNAYAYTYDADANRLTEQIGAVINTARFNALNQINSTAAGASRTNEWDAENRLTAVNSGNQRTEFLYDGLGRPFSIRQLVNGSQVSQRFLVWCEDEICEERDATGANITKRFFPQGVQLETGTNAGNYYYTLDHLGSIRDVVDASGTVRALYSYDPYGRQTLVTGDVPADFAFAGMFWTTEAGLALTHYRAYDPNLGRWLSRDPFEDAELDQGPNLYAYVADNPVNNRDSLGLCCENIKDAYDRKKRFLTGCLAVGAGQAESTCGKQYGTGTSAFNSCYQKVMKEYTEYCTQDSSPNETQDLQQLSDSYIKCLEQAATGECKPKPPPPKRPPPPPRKPPKCSPKQKGGGLINI
jgi:RHS repeat-associated protein